MKKKNLKKNGEGAPGPDSKEDSRVVRSKQVVLKVTWELLSENGLGGVSIDEVARRSGVAKTTIYRDWATRSDLLTDACSRMGSAQEVPNTGKFKSDITFLMKELSHLLLTARWSSILPSVIDAAERDPAIAEVHTRLQQGYAAPFREVIQRAIQSGELSRDCDPAILVSELLGPLFYRRWFSHEALDETFIETVFANVFESYFKPIS